MDDPLRRQLAQLLAWDDAHATFDSAVADLPAALRGVRPNGFAHSAWELVEHLRITQRDILDFCVAPDYAKRSWPDDYWPASPVPPGPEGWGQSLSAYREDRDALVTMTLDQEIDLLAPVPNGTGQTYLREILLVADHTSYHVGQLVLLRRALGIWGESSVTGG